MKNKILALASALIAVLRECEDEKFLDAVIAAVTFGDDTMLPRCKRGGKRTT